MNFFAGKHFPGSRWLLFTLAALLVTSALRAESGSLALTSPDFMPHGYSFFWDPLVLGLYVVSDSLIALSYFCILLGLVYLVRKRRDLPFNWIFWMFGLFIVSCGTTHLMEIWNIWHASYLAAEIVKAVTAVASLATVVMLIPFIPKAIALSGHEQLRTINYELQMQCVERERAEAKLKQTLTAREETLASLTEHQSAVEDLQLAQVALRDSRQRMDAIIQSAMDAIITVDEQQTVVIFNAAAERMFGCTREDALGAVLTRFIPRRFHAAHSGHIQRFGETGVSSRSMGTLGAIWGLRANGEEFPVEASISHAESEGRKLFTVILRDITERKQAQAAREWLAAVVDSSEDAIISKTLEGIITGWNRGALRVFGYTAAEAIGKPLLMLIPPERDGEEPEIQSRIRQGESVQHFETVRMRKDGTRIDVSVTISAIRDSNGKIVGASNISRDITESKRAQTALIESEQRLQAMANNLPQLAWMAEANGDIFWYNQRWYEYTRTTFEQMQGWGWQTVHDPEVLPRVLEGWKAAIESGSPFEMEFPLRAADGCFGAFLTRVTPLRDANGCVLRWFGTNTDITALKQVEERSIAQAHELARSRQALEEQARVLDLAPVMVRDMQSRIVMWPQGAEKLYGIPAQEALGRVSHELLQTQFPEPLDAMEKKLFADGVWEGELVHRKRGGGILIVASLWMLYRDDQGQPVRILEVNADITDRKRAEKRLSSQAEELSRQAEELLRSRAATEGQARILKLVLDSMGEGLVAANTEGHFLLWNDAADKLMGRQAEDLPLDEWTPHYQIFMPDGTTPYPPQQLPLARALRGESVQSELMIHHPGQQRAVFLEVTARPLKDDAGKLQGGVAAFRDITDRRKSEQVIQKLNQELEQRVVERTAELEATNKDLEAFTYSVSHDLRAPLRHMSGFTRILVEDFAAALPEEAQRHLQRIEQGAQRMGVLVDELLNLTRVGRQPLTMQVTGLSSIVTEVLTLFEAELEERKVEWKIGELPFVECDPNLVRQVFQNLIGNALKYSRPRSPAVIEIGQTEKDGQRVLFVRDNGVGFSMKYADKLFGVFQRLHRAEDFEGTGVGLATVQRIVKKHGGQIWAEAELDKGATFYLTLGSAEPSAQQLSASAGGS
jgi:PAS domain S-box-containing protein